MENDFEYGDAWAIPIMKSYIEAGMTAEENREKIQELERFLQEKTKTRQEVTELFKGLIDGLRDRFGQIIRCELPMLWQATELAGLIQDNKIVVMILFYNFKFI